MLIIYQNKFISFFGQLCFSKIPDSFMNVLFGYNTPAIFSGNIFDPSETHYMAKKRLEHSTLNYVDTSASDHFR